MQKHEKATAVAQAQIVQKLWMAEQARNSQLKKENDCLHHWMRNTDESAVLFHDHRHQKQPAEALPVDFVNLEKFREM